MLHDDEQRLTDPAYWDAQYASSSAGAPERPTAPLRSLVKRLVGSRVQEWARDYREYLLWEVIYPRHFGARRGARVLEVGSAPGNHLIQLHHEFGFEPHGVEYSEHGVRLNRALFQLDGLDPDRIHQADFFSTAFQSHYAEFFDIVVSRGFIEHFTDVRAVIAAHVRLLAPGGLLVITIPNLSGINYALQWWFKREVLPLHNLTIMRRSTFQGLFRDQGLSTLQCGYYGTFSFGVFAVSQHSWWRRWTAWMCWQLQLTLNVVFRLVLGRRGAESPFASPYLIYVGAKTD